MPKQKDTESKLLNAEKENTRLKSELEKYESASPASEVCSDIVAYVKEGQDPFGKQADENIYTRSSTTAECCTVS